MITDTPLPQTPFLLRKMLTEARTLEADSSEDIKTYAVHYALSLKPRVQAEKSPKSTSISKSTAPSESKLDQPSKNQSNNPTQSGEKSSEPSFPLASLIGKTVRLQWTEVIYCIHCGRKTKKSFSQGYCYVCFMRLARTDICNVRPELCHHAKGTCREEDWAEKHCFIPHTLYLAFSDKVKVGITREQDVRTRWMDQGALFAIPIAVAENRLESGRAEIALKESFSDKTSWQKMLSSRPDEETYTAATQTIRHAATQASPLIQTLQKTVALREETFATPPHLHHFRYPLNDPPLKVRSLSLDRSPLIEDTLIGIKGQYWVFESGVLNIRKFAGYEVLLSSPA